MSLRSVYGYDKEHHPTLNRFYHINMMNNDKVNLLNSDRDLYLFNPNFVPGDDNAGGHIMAGYLEFFIRSNCSPVPLYPISYKGSNKPRKNTNYKEDRNMIDINFYNPRYKKSSKPLKSILKKTKLFGWASQLKYQQSNNRNDDMEVDTDQIQKKRVHFDVDINLNEESEHANFPKEVHEASSHYNPDEDEDQDGEGVDSEECESEVSTGDEMSLEEQTQSILTNSINVDRKSDTWLDDFEEKVIKIESYKIQYQKDINANNKKMIERNRHQNVVYYGYLSTDERKSIIKKQRNIIGRDISRKYMHFQTNMLKKWNLLDSLAVNFFEDNKEGMYSIRKTILKFNGYQFIDHYKEWKYISEYLRIKYNLEYDEARIKEFYLRYFYLFDLFQSWNLTEDHYFILEKFNPNRIKSISEYHLKFTEKIKYKTEEDYFAMKKQAVMEELQRWIGNNIPAIKITNFLWGIDLSFDDLYLEYFIELYPKSEVVTTLQNYGQSECFVKNLDMLEIRSTLEVAWEGEFKGWIKNQIIDYPKSMRVTEIASSLHDKPTINLKFESNFPKFIVPDKSYLTYARSKIVGITSPEILFIQPGFIKKWKWPYLGFNEYYVNISEIPVWFYIVQPLEEKSFRGIISSLQRRTIVIKKKTKNNNDKENFAYDKVNPFNLSSFDENISVYPEYFAANNCKVIMTQLLKGEMLVIKKGCYYQYFTKYNRCKTEIKMLHWHWPFQSKEHIQYALETSEKWHLSGVLQFITPYILLMDYINIKISELDKEMLSYFTELFLNKIEAELEQRISIVDQFSSKTKDKFDSNNKLLRTSTSNILLYWNTKDSIIPIFELEYDNQQFNFWHIWYWELFLYYVKATGEKDFQPIVICWAWALKNWFSSENDHHHKARKYRAIGFYKKFMLSWVYQLVIQMKKISKELKGNQKLQSLETKRPSRSKKSELLKYQIIHTLIYNGDIEWYFYNQRIAWENIDRNGQNMWYQVKLKSKDDLSDPRLETFQKSFNETDDTHDSEAMDAQMNDNDMSRISDLVSPNKLIINDQIKVKIKQEDKKIDEKILETPPQNIENKQKKRELKEKIKQKENGISFSSKKFEMYISNIKECVEEGKDLKSRARADIEYYNPNSQFNKSLTRILNMNISKDEIKCIDFPGAWKCITFIKSEMKPHKKYIKIINELINKWKKLFQK